MENIDFEKIFEVFAGERQLINPDDSLFQSGGSSLELSEVPSSSSTPQRKALSQNTTLINRSDKWQNLTPQRNALSQNTTLINRSDKRKTLTPKPILSLKKRKVAHQNPYLDGLEKYAEFDSPYSPCTPNVIKNLTRQSAVLTMSRTIVNTFSASRIQDVENARNCGQMSTVASMVLDFGHLEQTAINKMKDGNDSASIDCQPIITLNDDEEEEEENSEITKGDIDQQTEKNAEELVSGCGIDADVSEKIPLAQTPNSSPRKSLVDQVPEVEDEILASPKDISVVAEKSVQKSTKENTTKIAKENVSKLVDYSFQNDNTDNIENFSNIIKFSSTVRKSTMLPMMEPSVDVEISCHQEEQKVVDEPKDKTNVVAEKPDEEIDWKAVFKKIGEKLNSPDSALLDSQSSGGRISELSPNESASQSSVASFKSPASEQKEDASQSSVACSRSSAPVQEKNASQSSVATFKSPASEQKEDASQSSVACSGLSAPVQEKSASQSSISSKSGDESSKLSLVNQKSLRKISLNGSRKSFRRSSLPEFAKTQLVEYSAESDSLESESENLKCTSSKSIKASWTESIDSASVDNSNRSTPASRSRSYRSSSITSAPASPTKSSNSSSVSLASDRNSVSSLIESSKSFLADESSNCSSSVSIQSPDDSSETKSGESESENSSKTLKGRKTVSFANLQKSFTIETDGESSLDQMPVTQSETAKIVNYSMGDSECSSNEIHEPSVETKPKQVLTTEIKEVASNSVFDKSGRFGMDCPDYDSDSDSEEEPNSPGQVGFSSDADDNEAHSDVNSSVRSRCHSLNSHGESSPEINIQRKKKAPVVVEKIIVPPVVQTGNLMSLRRSGRTRMKPLDYWRNERPMYQAVQCNVGKELLYVPSVIGVSKGSDLPIRKVRRPKSRQSHQAGPEKEQKKHMTWENCQNLSIHVKNKASLENNDNEGTMEQVKKWASFKFEESKKSKGVYIAIIDRDKLTVGMLKFDPKAKKVMADTGSYHSIFTVVYGVFCLTHRINEEKQVSMVKTGDIFKIGPGEAYSLVNLRNDQGFVQFSVTTEKRRH